MASHIDIHRFADTFGVVQVFFQVMKLVCLQRLHTPTDRVLFMADLCPVCVNLTNRTEASLYGLERRKGQCPN